MIQPRRVVASSWIPIFSEYDADDASGAVSSVGAVVEVGVGLERAISHRARDACGRRERGRRAPRP